MKINEEVKKQRTLLENKAPAKTGANALSYDTPRLFKLHLCYDWKMIRRELAMIRICEYAPFINGKMFGNKNMIPNVKCWDHAAGWDFKGFKKK